VAFSCERCPFPADVDHVSNEGVKLLGAPVGTKAFTVDFTKKKLKVLKEVCDILKEVDNAQVELGLFRGCLAFNKINHLLRTCPPDLLDEALTQFDEHFHNILATILRLPCLSEDQWEQASLPVKFAGIGVNRTKIVAGPAYIGSCVLTRDLVAALLKRKKYEPAGVVELLAAHEETTSAAHDVADLSTQHSVQQLLSSERHEAIFQKRWQNPPSVATISCSPARCPTPAIGFLLLLSQVLASRCPLSSFVRP
jgi:hypothetical protein